MLAYFLGLVLGSAGAWDAAAQPAEGSGAATAAPAVEGTAVAADGTAIWYRAVGGGGPEARTLLLIHGGPGISYHYMLGLEALAGPDLRVATWSQRGLAGSSAPPQDHYGLTYHLEDVDAVLTALGVDRAILLGHSWGGLIAMHYAATRPDRVSALLLVSSMPASNEAWSASTLMQMLRVSALSDLGIIPTPIPTRTCEGLRAVAPAYFHDAGFVPPPELLESAEHCSHEVAIWTRVQSLPPDFDYSAVLADVRAPVALVYGWSDWLGAAMISLAGAFDPLPDVYIVPGAGHIPWMEAPETTLSILREILAR